MTFFFATTAKAGQWREADRKTYETMIRVVGEKPHYLLPVDKLNSAVVWTMGKPRGNWLSKEELLDFPCTDLLTIDRLWVKYSNGKFGFSVQKKIWQEFGCPASTSKNWDKFCVRVGWQAPKTTRLLDYFKELKADPDFSPPGEFPVCLGWFRLTVVGKDGRVGCWCLFSRIETCKTM